MSKLFHPRIKLSQIGYCRQRPNVLTYGFSPRFKRHGAKREGLAIKKLPSEYFYKQIYTTFFNDAVGGHILSWWGTDNCMWSNDFPHGNSTWPHSRQVVSRDLGDLPAPLRAKLVRENVAQLYNIPVPSPIQ
jgi:hypothetical protein